MAPNVRSIRIATPVTFAKIRNVLRHQIHAIQTPVVPMLFARHKASPVLLANVLQAFLAMPGSHVLRENAREMKSAQIKKLAKTTTALILARSKLARRTTSVKLFVTFPLVDDNMCLNLKSPEKHSSLENLTNQAKNLQAQFHPGIIL